MRLVALLPAIGAALAVNAQSFASHFGGPRHQDAVATFADGQGLLTVVRDVGEAEGDVRIRLLRTTDAGVEQAWYDVALFPGAAFVQGAVQAGGSALVLCGSLISLGQSSHDAFVAKVDLQGALQWAWTTNTADTEEQLLDVQRLPDGRFAAGGMRRSGGDSDAYLVLVDANGDAVWDMHTGTSADEKINALAVDANGITAVGQVTDMIRDQNALVLRTDLSGAVQWSRSPGGRRADAACGVVALSSSTFVWAGYTDSFGDTTHYGVRQRNIRLMAMSVAGDSLWAKAIGDTLTNRSAFALARTSNGDLLIGGKRNLTTDGEALVVHAGPAGDVQWEQGYDVQGEDEVRALFPLPGDSGFVGAGWCFGAEGGEVLLLRKNAQGQ